MLLVPFIIVVMFASMRFPVLFQTYKVALTSCMLSLTIALKLIDVSLMWLPFAGADRFTVGFVVSLVMVRSMYVIV